MDRVGIFLRIKLLQLREGRLLASFQFVLFYGLLSRMDWDDKDESISDRGDRHVYSDEDSSNNEEDYQCGEEDQQSQSEDIDVSPLLCKSHKDKVDLSCAHCKAVSALLSKDQLALLLKKSLLPRKPLYDKRSKSSYGAHVM